LWKVPREALSQKRELEKEMEKENPATFRDLLRYVRASGRAVQARFTILMAAVAICAAVFVLAGAEAIIRGLQ
jgi:hypothetical protein